VPKVHIKPIQSQKKLLKRKEQRKPKCSLVWRTRLFGAPPDSVRCTREERLQTLHLRVSQAHLRYNSPDCPVCHRTVRCASGATIICAQRLTLQSKQCESDVRAAVRGAPDCPVSHRTIRCHMRTKPPTVDQLQALTGG
jgi:hypothetical protein